MKIGRLLMAITLVAGVRLHADDQQVTIRLAWNEPPGDAIATTLHLRNTTGSVKPLDLAADGGEASATLPPGQWLVSASSPGYWSEAVLVSVADRPTEAAVRLYRAARVRARVTIPSGTPRSLDVYFNPTEPASGQPSSSTSCAVEKGLLDCELPAGLHDLAFRISGHSSVYRWEVDLRKNPSVDLGKLAFHRGATLSGRVEVDDGAEAGALARAQVHLRNAAGRSQ